MELDHNMIHKLGDLLTPGLFDSLVKARLPYGKQDSIDFSELGRDIFLEDPFGPVIKEEVWPVLIELSKVGLDDIPDLSAFLPHPDGPSYPEQCLGLQLLLDHCPRLLFRGIDQRWTYDYFNKLSERLGRTWLTLPPAQRPDSWERWHNAGAELDYWIAIRFWFGTPFVHSELPESQKIAIAFTEETRFVVEQISGQTDPYRATRQHILLDLYGFPREYRKGPPQGGDVTRESWTFWMGMLMDVHKPIVDVFGRYPYLNAICGRESTREEERWAEDTDHFGEASQKVARRVKEDVKLGRWTPLGEDSGLNEVKRLRSQNQSTQP